MKKLLLVGLITLSSAANATLIGDTVNYLNAVNSFNENLVVSDAVEFERCFLQVAGDCQLLAQVDFGADFISGILINTATFDVTVAPNVDVFSGLEFSSGAEIVGIDVLVDTFPTVFIYSFTPDSVMVEQLEEFNWSAGSTFEYKIQLITATVPEPSTFGLLAAGLLGLFMRRKRIA